MSWLKFLLGGLIIVFCMVLSYFASEKYRLRKNFYQQFERFHELYLTELQYRRKAIKDVIEEGAYTGEFAKVVCQVLQNKTVEIKCAFLSEEERSDGEYYFSVLGRGDVYSQTAFFSSKTQELAKKKSECEAIAKERTQLYLKLGLLSGLAFVILII